MNYNNENLLEMVELYAEQMGFIASEDEASEMFDSEVMPGILEAHSKPGVPFDDEAMINEEFANWLDSLAKDGEIHPEQYDSYEYTGQWA